MERVFAKRTVREFWEKHAETEQYLKTWYDTVKNCNWQSPSDVKQTYSTVNVLKSGRLVFNIKGNDYRLVAKINFQKQWLFIRFIGSHAEYDKIDANTI